jgi:hypothetical protein
MKQKYLILMAFATIYIINVVSLYAATTPTHFNNFLATDNDCTYAGKVTINNGGEDIQAVDMEDEIGVFVSDNNGGEILVGGCVMGDLLPGYYFVHVYGDDPTTSTKDGALANDQLIFKVWDSSENKDNYAISMHTEEYQGMTLPTIPPVWMPSSSYGLLNLSAKSNQSPILDPIGAKSCKETNTLSFLVSGHDPDGDNIQFSAVNLPETASFQNSTFSWTTGYSDAGIYTVTFIITDDGQPAMSSNEDVVITVENVNRKPSLNPIAQKSVNENEQLEFTLMGTDPDRDVLTYSAEDIPQGAALNTQTGVFSWFTSYEDEGSYTLTVMVADPEGLTDAKQLIIHVAHVNRPPVFDPVVSQNIDEGNPLTITVSATDPDQDEIVYSADSLPDGANFNPDTQVFTWTPGCADEGETSVIFTVTDDGTPQLSDQLEIAILVNNVACHFNTQINQTPDVMDIYGYATIGDSDPIAPNDEVGIFDTNDQLCGVFVVETEGSFGIMHIYGDDVSTQGIKEGPAPGEKLTIKIYDISEDSEYSAGFQESGMVDSIKMEFSLAFTPNASIQMNMQAFPQQSIPLHIGWNLISYSTNTVYYVGQIPTVFLIEGVQYKSVQSIAEALTSIDGQYTYVRGFDSTGAKSYNNTPFSDMKYMAPGYGYWIKIKDDADVDENGLVYFKPEGTFISGKTAIRLHPSWNLVGYLGNKVMYVPPKPVNVPFPDGTIFCKVSDKSCFLASIDGQYEYVRGFDKTGAKSYNLTPFSDLTYVGPGYGYWIKVIQTPDPVILIWDHDECECLD